MIVNEGIKVISLKNNFITSIIWTSVWSQFCNWGSVIVQEVDLLRCVLLAIEWDWEWNSFLNNVRFRGVTVHIVWIHEYRLNTFRSKVASSELVKVQEVISPDFYSSVAVLDTIPRVDSSYYGVFVVPEADRIFEVWEVSWEGNCEGNNFISPSRRRVLALEASVILS